VGEERRLKFNELKTAHDIHNALVSMPNLRFNKRIMIKIISKRAFFICYCARTGFHQDMARI